LTAFEALNWSLKLDYEFLFRVPDISCLEKVLFVLKKYGIFLKSRLFGLKEVNCVTVFGQDYFYNEAYGLASLQRVYCASHRLKGLLPDRPIIVDVGANVGQFTFFCQHYLRAERIVSIEPIKDCHELLQANAGIPSDCFNCLVSCDNGVKEFYRCTTSSQLSSCLKDEHESYAQGMVVSCKRLDELVRECGVEKVDLLKVDTEGSEYDVLLSGEEILETVGLIMVEMSVFRNSDGNIFKTGSFLNNRKFELVAVERWRGTMPKDMDAIFARR
jgi:FkbM family methyltransferase